MSDTPKPLPCPFCGSPAVVYLLKPDSRADARACAAYPMWSAKCSDCLGVRMTMTLKGGSFRTQAEAIAAWNRRAPVTETKP